MAQTRAGVYFCRQPARCVAALPGGDCSRHSFMVGTCTLQQRNEIHVVDFHEETADVVCRQTLSHPDEIWQMSVNPSQASQVLTYSAGNCSPSVRLWRVSDLTQPDTVLHEVASVTAENLQLAAVKGMLWDPHREGNLLLADAEGLHVFESGGGSKFSETMTVQVGQRCSSACMDPHHANQVSTVDDTHLKTWDLRSSKLMFKKDGAHLFGARDVDYNPNVPYQVLTTGEDAALRFWDLRKLDRSLRTLSGGHHHWVVKARYNGHHDQLVLSCGTDSAVCLWRAASVASVPLGTDHRGEGSGRPPDGLVKRYEEHEDSCYSCCWSLSDAWVFASVAYDGRLVVNRVPGEEKYRILL